MIRNRDFAMLYAGRAVSTRENEFAGVVVGWNDMQGVILGIDRTGWQAWGANDMRVSGEEFMSYEYRNAGVLAVPGGQAGDEAPKHRTTGGQAEGEAPKHRTTGELIKEHESVTGIRFSTDAHGNVQAAYIRGKRGGMELVSTGDGSENVSSKIQNVWKH